MSFDFLFLINYIVDNLYFSRFLEQLTLSF